MATQKPISTISYNTEPFLREKLDSWVSAHIIQAYQYICHKGEDGDKDHIHLRIEPNKKLDPMDLMEQLKEFPFGCKKPLGCRPFRPSKEEDWFLYAVHDEQYLSLKYGGAEKGEKLPYSWESIIVPEYYDLECAFIRAKASLKHSSVNMASRLQQGESALDLVLQGENVYLVNGLMRALAGTDYQRLAQENAELSRRLAVLEQACDDAGFSIEADDTGRIVLVRANK